METLLINKTVSLPKNSNTSVLKFHYTCNRIMMTMNDETLTMFENRGYSNNPVLLPATVNCKYFGEETS